MDLTRGVVLKVPPTPLPEYSKELANKMKQEIECLADFEPDSQLNNFYQKSAEHSIVFHTDNRALFTDTIVSLGLWGDCNFVFQEIRDPEHKVTVYFPRRALLIMRGPSRYEWKHGIPTECLLSPQRISITLRKINHSTANTNLLDKWMNKTQTETKEDFGDLEESSGDVIILSNEEVAALKQQQQQATKSKQQEEQGKEPENPAPFTPADMQKPTPIPTPATTQPLNSIPTQSDSTEVDESFVDALLAHIGETFEQNQQLYSSQEKSTPPALTLTAVQSSSRASLCTSH